jgi:hypothetical protein
LTLAGGAADITEGVVTGEIKFVGERLKIGRGDSTHRVHKLLEPFRPAVELREHGRASVLDFILRLAGPQAFGKITSE